MEFEPAPPHSAEERPTHVRYFVVLLTMLTAVLLYLDRFCISFAERYIKEDLDLTNDQVAFMLGAAMLAYALAQVPSGLLSDLFGARRMLTLYILFWSLFTGLTGLALGFGMFLIWRLGFGLAQAGAYPTSASLIGRWVPTSARGKASSVVAFGGRIGGFSAPILTGLLIVYFVPTSVTSQIQADDILDYPALCHKLTRGDAPLGTRILAGMDADTQSNIRWFGSRYELAHKSHVDSKVPLTKAVADLELPEPTADQRQALAQRLNEILDQRDFYKPSWFADVELSREAESLLRASDGLSQDEQQRLNRLLLEAAYPGSLRQVYVAGWRPVMIVFGLAGLLVAAAFWICFRDRPQDHPWCNRAEVELIEEGRPASELDLHVAPPPMPWKPLLTSASMWLMCFAQFTTNIGWFFLVSWLPRYLKEVHRVPIEERALLVSIPIFVGWFGMLTGGWLTDRLTRALGKRWGRALPLAVSRFSAMGAYCICVFDPDPYLATFAFSLVAFSTDLGSPAVWAFNLDVGGRYVGSILGWGNMFGNIGAAISPVLLNRFMEIERWDLVFLTCGLAFFLSGVCALGINAAVPIRAETAQEHT